MARVLFPTMSGKAFPLRTETDQQAKHRLVLVGTLCAAIFLATLPLPRVDNHLVGSDGVRYYAITRSLLLDGDFDFRNDYQLLGEHAGLTATGLPANEQGIGTAILWMPFFLVAHVVSLLLNAMGARVPTNGVSYLYEASACLGTIVYATLGFLLTYGTARRILGSPPGRTSWSVVGMWWATPAIYYIIAEPSMSHGLTVFTMATFFALWYPPSPDRSTWHWVKLAGAAGLASLVRWQDGLIILIPLAELCWWVVRRRVSPARALTYLSMSGALILVVFSPQLLMWKTLYGSFLTIPQGTGFFNWSSPHVLATLFSTRHGLISWHPIFLLGVLGLVPLWKEHREVALVILFVFAGELYVNSAVSNWWADDAFGGRRFVSLIPFLTVPLTVVLTRMRRRLVAAVLAALVLWNGLSLIQYRLRFVSMSEPLTIREMTVDRLLVPFRLIQSILR